MALLALSFHWGATEHARYVNKSRDAKDQGAYLNLSSRMAASRQVEVDGARPPLYPALISLVHEPGLSKQQFFELGKRQSIRVTLVAWLVLLLALRRWLKPLTALATWAAIGFTLLMFYAPYVKAEALFYVLATCSFLCMLDVIHRPRYGIALLTGVITGAAQLSKESMLPALGLFAAVQALAALVRGFSRWRRAEARPLRRVLRRTLTVPIVLVAFFVTVYPHVRVNRQVFGHYFYNVNSYFYIWYDSWGAVVRGTRKYGDREGWPRLPPEKIPSARSYFQSHSGEQIRDRVLRGAQGALSKAAESHGFLRYAWYGLLGAAIAFVTTRSTRRFALRHWPVALFCGGYFAGYFLMCTWFFAIHPGVRFIAALAPPLLVLGAWLSDRAPRAGRTGALGVVTLIVAASLAVDLPEILRHGVRQLTAAGW